MATPLKSASKQVRGTYSFLRRNWAWGFTASPFTASPRCLRTNHYPQLYFQVVDCFPHKSMMLFIISDPTLTSQCPLEHGQGRVSTSVQSQQRTTTLMHRLPFARCKQLSFSRGSVYRAHLAPVRSVKYNPCAIIASTKLFEQTRHLQPREAEASRPDAVQYDDPIQADAAPVYSLDEDRQIFQTSGGSVLCIIRARRIDDVHFGSLFIYEVLRPDLSSILEHVSQMMRGSF